MVKFPRNPTTSRLLNNWQESERKGKGCKKLWTRLKAKGSLGKKNEGERCVQARAPKVGLEASVEGLRLSPFNLGEVSLNCILGSYQCRLCTQEGEALFSKCFVHMSPSLHNWSIRTCGKKRKDAGYDNISRHWVMSSKSTIYIQLFRERLSEKLCMRQSQKVIWDMINNLFLTL